MTHAPLAARDWAKPLWGAIGLYVVSIVVWLIVSFVLIGMRLENPVRSVALLWGFNYPLTLVIGLSSAIIARGFGAWRAYIHLLLLPLYATLLAIVMALVVIIGG